MRAVAAGQGILFQSPLCQHRVAAPRQSQPARDCPILRRFIFYSWQMRKQQSPDSGPRRRQPPAGARQRCLFAKMERPPSDDDLPRIHQRQKPQIRRFVVYSRGCQIPPPLRRGYSRLFLPAIICPRIAAAVSGRD